LRKTQPGEKSNIAPVHSFDSLPVKQGPQGPDQAKRLSLPNTAPTTTKFKWVVTVIDAERWNTLFLKTDANKDGFVDKNEVTNQLSIHGADTTTVDKIW
jgi:hypothetical protein